MGGEGQHQEADGQAGVGGIHDEVLPFPVEHDAGNGPGQGDGQGIDHEEQGAGGHQFQFSRIGGQEAQHAGIAHGHKETHDGDPHDPGFQEIGQGQLFQGGPVFFGQLDLIHFHHESSGQAHQHHGDGEQDDHAEGEHLLQEHADERSDGCSQAHAQGIVVDALAPAFGRDHGGHDGAGGGGGNAVAHPVQQPDPVHHGQGVHQEVHAGGHQVEQDPGVQHLLPAVQFHRAAGKQPGHQGPQHEQPGSQARFADGSIQGMDGLGSNDDHQHIIDDVDQEIDQGVQHEPSGPQTRFGSHNRNQHPFFVQGYGSLYLP